MKDELSDFEFTLLWMAIRYAIDRGTITSATLPGYIILNWYSRMNDGHKRSIVGDIKLLFKEHVGHDRYSKPHWDKFLAALDEDRHFQVELIDDTIIDCFACGKTIYPLHKYIEAPHSDIYIPEENIVTVWR